MVEMDGSKIRASRRAVTTLAVGRSTSTVLGVSGSGSPGLSTRCVHSAALDATVRDDAMSTMRSHEGERRPDGRPGA